MLQPKLNLKVSQRQVLTPGLVQMVSVLALNKLELKEMINAEIVENPVLEEIEESGVTLEEMAGREAALERPAAEEPAKAELVKLRFFTGLTIPQAAQALGISEATAERHWTYARVWLYCELDPQPQPPPQPHVQPNLKKSYPS